MAKKKASSDSQHNKPLQNQQDDLVQTHQHVMDPDASDKFERLKSLNRMLLEQAVERRNEVDSLIQSKESLVSDLGASNSEREALRSEVSVLSERAAQLELERSVVSVFVAAQAGQKVEVIEGEMIELKRAISVRECEIGRLSGKLGEIEGVLGNEREVTRRVCLERDGLKSELDLKVEEGKALRASLVEFEERKREIEREVGELRVAYKTVVGEKVDMGTMVESLTREKDSIERSLVESSKLIEDMKEELRSVVREKEGVEGEKNVEMVKRLKLDNDVSGLNEMVVNLRKEEEKLRVNVAMLENKCVEGDERRKDMMREIEELVKDRKLSEKSVERLISEKHMIEKDLGDALKQLDERRCEIEEMVKEKIVLLEAKGRLGVEVGELQNRVGELKDVVLKLEELTRVQMETIKSLESEIVSVTHTLEQVKVERDGMNNCLSEEKNNALNLKAKIVELEKQMDESLKGAMQVNAKSDATFAEKMELESQCGLLKKEITHLESTLTEARNEFNSMKGKVEAADANAERTLNMLKDTSALCAKDESYTGEESEACVMEIEMIKKGFKGKESEVENMKKQLELLQDSMEEACRKKSFWTVLSSATTLLAAVSVAYVARGR